MRGFKEKIDWQRKILESANSHLPFERQLPGLTERTVLLWADIQEENVEQEFKAMILRASKLAGSINDFSVPVTMPIESIRNELGVLCDRIESFSKSKSW